MYQKVCAHCAAQFEHVSRNTRYCSDICATKRNTKRRHARSAYKANAEQARLEVQARKLARMVVAYHKVPSRCNSCSCETRLEVHHRDQNPLNNQLSNLEILCKECHEQAHSELVRLDS